MRAYLASFIADESGATAIEYALIATFISIVIVASLTQIGLKLNTVFTNVESSFP